MCACSEELSEPDNESESDDERGRGAMAEKPQKATPTKPVTPPILPPPSLPTLQFQRRKTDQSDSSSSSSSRDGGGEGRAKGESTPSQVTTT